MVQSASRDVLQRLGRPGSGASPKKVSGRQGLQVGLRDDGKRSNRGGRLA